MSKHKSEDYKISAVNYYLDNDVSMDYVCNIFNCKKQSLSRWVKRYNINKSIKRNNRKSMSYKNYTVQAIIQVFHTYFCLQY
jgi:transposase-like protein